ncbi:MAG: hypothetical protein ACTII7_07160 [Galactobacter sp.]
MDSNGFTPAAMAVAAAWPEHRAQDTGLLQDTDRTGDADHG